LTYIKKYISQYPIWLVEFKLMRPAPTWVRSERARNLHLRHGLNVHAGQVTHRAVDDALQLSYTPAEFAIRISRKKRPQLAAKQSLFFELMCIKDEPCS